MSPRDGYLKRRTSGPWPPTAAWRHPQCSLRTGKESDEKRYVPAPAPRVAGRRCAHNPDGEPGPAFNRFTLPLVAPLPATVDLKRDWVEGRGGTGKH